MFKSQELFTDIYPQGAEGNDCTPSPPLDCTPSPPMGWMLDGCTPSPPITDLGTSFSGDLSLLQEHLRNSLSQS